MLDDWKDETSRTIYSMMAPW